MSAASARTRMMAARAFVALVWRRFVGFDCLTVAAALSYTELLALVPLIAIGFAVMAAFPVFDTIQADIQAFIFSNFLPSAVESASHYFDQFVGNARGLTALGIIGLAVTAMLLMFTIESALNVIFHVSHPRALVPRILVFWAMLTFGPLVLGASVSAAAYVSAYTRLIGGEAAGSMFSLTTPLLPTLLAIFGCTLFYYIVPNRPVLFRHAVIGATLAGLGLALLKEGFGYYLQTFPTYQTLYGALSVVPVFLVWTYLTWALILAGAVVTAALPEWGLPAADAHVPVSAVTQLRTAVALLAALYEATRSEKGGIRRRRLLRAAGTTAVVHADTTLTALRAFGYAGVTTDGFWLPRRDASSVTLYQLARDLGMVAALDAGLAEEDSPWARRLETLLAADADSRRALFSVTLQDLFAAPAQTPDVAAPLALRRAPELAV